MNVDVDKLVQDFEKEKEELFLNLDNICYINSQKVLNAFKKYQVSESDLMGTNGYGYNDTGRDKIEKVFAEVLGAEDALVRPQLISGTHALTVTLFALLRPGDLLLSINGKPYDTLDEVIGIRDNPSSLKSYNIKYDSIDLVNNDFDYNKIKEYLKNNKVKVIAIQRSVGYANRDTIGLDKIEKVAKIIKEINKDIIIMVDNCYCEFVNTEEPLKYGADIIVNGYAFTRCKEGYKILNLNRPEKATVLSQDGEVLETSMDDIEIKIVKDYLEKNKKFMEE